MLAGLFFLALLACAGWLYFGQAWPKTDRLVFLAVGQGDAILFETVRGQRVLIDGGPDGVAAKVLERYLPWWDRRLNAVVATHSDLDHIGGLEQILRNFEVGGLYMAKSIEPKPALEDLVGSARRQAVPVWLLADDYRLDFSAGSFLQLLVDLKPSTSNENSLVSVLHDEEADVILMADVGFDEEGRLLAEWPTLRPEIIKIGHHGSDLSTSEEMLLTWQPQQAVISVGRGNRFGHPSPRVLKRLERQGVPFLRTDEQGDIAYNLADGHWRIDKN